LSDQTEKPKGALPKGYDANTTSTENTPSTEVVKQKKINFLELVRYTSTDQDQREKDLKEYEASYITRLEKNKPEESSDDFRVELGVSTESDDDLGKLNLRKHTVTKREELQAERKKYEKKYLTRYKQPKAKPIKSSNLKSGVDIGKLTLRQYVNTKRKAKQKEIKKYEQKYLSRYKQPKIKKKSSSFLYKPEIPKPKRNMQKERKEYEQKYLSRYKQPKSGVKKSTSWTQHDVALGRLTLSPHFNAKRRAKQDEIREYEKQYLSRYKEPKPKKRAIQLEWEPKPKQDIRKERKEYENEFLTRYKKQQKAKPKKNVSKPSKAEPKIDRKKELKNYEKEYISRLKNNL